MTKYFKGNERTYRSIGPPVKKNLALPMIDDEAGAWHYLLSHLAQEENLIEWLNARMCG